MESLQLLIHACFRLQARLNVVCKCARTYRAGAGDWVPGAALNKTGTEHALGGMTLLLNGMFSTESMYPARCQVCQRIEMQRGHSQAVRVCCALCFTCARKKTYEGKLTTAPDTRRTLHMMRAGQICVLYTVMILWLCGTETWGATWLQEDAPDV
jgi:hypothetical protein